MKSVCVTTLGCRLNQYESDAIERQLAEAGYDVVASETLPAEAPPAFYVLNTCSITHLADAEARTLVARLRGRHPHSHIVVTGCYATAAPQEVAALEGVSLVVDNGAKDRLVGALATLSADGPGAAGPVPVIGHGVAGRGPLPQLLPNAAARRSRVYLKVQDGCDYRCSFCIVPSVRGKSRSLAPTALADALTELVDAGVPEVVLTGVHLGTYGRDLTPRTSLVELLRRLLPRLGDARLRLSSLDPHEVDAALIELLRTEPRLCPYLHLPVQSCDDGILRAMRRAHTAQDFVLLVPRLASAIPDIALGSDVIVGFPGEGDAEFDNTYQTLQSLPLSYLHVFSYSKRSGTPAATLPGQVPAPQIARRSRALRDLSKTLHQRFAARFVGRQLPVVVHRAPQTGTGLLTGVTANHLKVRFAAPAALCGSTALVEIVEAGADCVRGVLRQSGGRRHMTPTAVGERYQKLAADLADDGHRQVVERLGEV